MLEKLKEEQYFNDFFKSQKSVSVQNGFKYIPVEGVFFSTFKIVVEKETLVFDVHIPENYPFEDLRFIPKDVKGYPHQFPDTNAVCLNTPFIDHLDTRLKFEFDRLNGWIEKYYINGEVDKFYEYVPVINPVDLNFLFQENAFSEDRLNERFGKFDYSVLNIKKDDKGKEIGFDGLVHNIGNYKAEWSLAYNKGPKYHGIWVILEDEPITQKNSWSRIQNWKYILEKLPPKFIEYLVSFRKNEAGYKIFPKNFTPPHLILGIGYKIPSITNSVELHWDFIALNRSQLPKENYDFLMENFAQTSKAILWCNSINASHQRFFGRGAIAEVLSNSRILIIGNGAIGSSLSEILVRGGCKKIDLSDFDSIGPGNICRGIFNFANIGKIKSVFLKDHLQNISPFVDINVNKVIVPLSQFSEDFMKSEEFLNGYDIIFDCSGNNRIISMLSKMELKGTLFHIAITNKANEMLFLNNRDSSNLYERSNLLLYSLGSLKESTFREGAGCYHPTFEASFFDINQLLNFSVKRINENYKSGAKLKSFFVTSYGTSIQISEDVKFYQKELNLYLTIEEKCLESIYDYVHEFYPNEFGGLLMGNYINNNTEVVICDVIIPDKFSNSRTGFISDNNSLNKKLKDFYLRNNGNLIYIGDWHSHPNLSNLYSKTDFESIQLLAKSNAVNTHNPLLLIVSYDGDNFDPGFYVYFKTKLHKFKRH